MNSRLSWTIVLLFISCFIYSQEETMSKADILFYEYSYSAAIQEYKKEMTKNRLSDKQSLNLADAYFKTGNYKSASDAYFNIYKKDSTMSTYHFNNLLQSMTKTSGIDRTKALLATRTSYLSSELLENAEFNFELLESKDDADEGLGMFNIRGNSPQADFSPSFYKDRILFTSGRDIDSKSVYRPSGEAYLDVFVAHVNSDGDVMNPNPFEGLPDTEFHQATPYYSEELGSIFFINSNEEDDEMLFDDKGKNALGIGRADSNGDLFYLLRDVSTSFYYPFFDVETGNLYFAADFEEGYGGTDLYYVRTNKGQIMSAPINLGPRINTPGNEIAPYIFDSSFYYASDVFYGLGEMDIYKSEIQGESEFSIPVNLGEGINSSADDFGLIIKDHGEEGLIGYFASNRPGGKGGDDIYGFRMAKKPGLKTFALKGEIINSETDDRITKARIRLLDSVGTTIKETYSDEDGSYRIEIPWQYPLTIIADKNKYSTYTANYSESQMESIKSDGNNIALAGLDDLLEEQEDQMVVEINKFYFSRGSSRLPTTATAELDKVVDVMNKFPQLQIRIEAHTDSRGGSSTNFRLSQARANRMKQYLLDNGVPESMILYTVGYGEDKIINQCTNGVYCLEVYHKQNERYHFVILNYNLLE